MLQSVYISADLYFFPVMHKQRVLEPVIQLPLVRQSSDCIHFLLLLSLIGFLPLFLDCHVFDLPIHPPPPPPPQFFHPSVDHRSRGGKGEAIEENRVKASGWFIKEGLWGASHS